jgi:hypothetical protein
VFGSSVLQRTRVQFNVDGRPSRSGPLVRLVSAATNAFTASRRRKALSGGTIVFRTVASCRRRLRRLFVGATREPACAPYESDWGRCICKSACPERDGPAREGRKQSIAASSERISEQLPAATSCNRARRPAPHKPLHDSRDFSNRRRQPRVMRSRSHSTRAQIRADFPKPPRVA